MRANGRGNRRSSYLGHLDRELFRGLLLGEHNRRLTRGSRLQRYQEVVFKVHGSRNRMQLFLGARRDDALLSSDRKSSARVLSADEIVINSRPVQSAKYNSPRLSRSFAVALSKCFLPSKLKNSLMGLLTCPAFVNVSQRTKRTKLCCCYARSVWWMRENFTVRVAQFFAASSL